MICVKLLGFLRNLLHCMNFMSLWILILSMKIFVRILIKEVAK